MSMKVMEKWNEIFFDKFQYVLAIGALICYGIAIWSFVCL